MNAICTVEQQRERPLKRGWKPRAGDYFRKVRLIYRILKHPRTPFLARAVAGLSIGYIFSPIQLIPSFIPIIGWLDDAAVISAGTWLLLRLTPKDIIRECQQDATTKITR